MREKSSGLEIKVAPAAMDADLGHWAEDLAEVERAGADLVHVDIMDGHFVPNLLAGPREVGAIRSFTDLPIDVHLMITDPLDYVDRFAEAGADIIIFHAEVDANLAKVSRAVKDAGCRCGIALKPGTPAEAVEPVAGELDCVLVLTVEPGFSGQSFMPGPCEKISRLRELCESDIDIYVDGGIGPDTATVAVRAGANVLAAASAVFAADVPPAQAVKRLREAGERAAGEQEESQRD